MDQAKLPPDEARTRRLKIARRSRQKPEVKQKIREVRRKWRLEKRLEKVVAKDSGRATKPESDVALDVASSMTVSMWPVCYNTISSLAAISSSPLGKNKTSYGRSTRRRRSKAGVWARFMEFCGTN
ncbi:hypothetical protein CDAR_290251 [Caerostris darwini]|uniref:Uncharacterized protein n=1 Tax=Caerostris darwini TaxID=1538125 RepID=A0AAV4SWW9_9ARAC|nr:hypothetical protein CDAR_290251 [Caerostris darwini]